VAYKYASEALAMYQALGAETEAGFCLALMGFVKRLEGLLDEAESLLNEAFAIAGKTGDAFLRGFALSGLGSLLADRKDFVGAAKLKRESVEIFRQTGDRYVLELNTWSMGRISFQAGKIDEAYAFFRECAVTALELGNRWMVPHLVESAGQIARTRSEFEKGAKLFGAASVMRERLGLNFVPVDLQSYEAELEKLRGGVTPGRFAELWAEGRVMDPPEALELAYPGLRKKAKGEK
jgi:tetratricopeptide (TPR) repeat protein